MNQNVALCISGQMRSYKKCYGFLRENILKPLNPDVFIHTWQEQGGTTKKSGSAAEEDKCVSKESLEKLYSPTSTCVERFDQSYFTRKDGVVVPEELRRVTDHWKGNIPMFYKMFECNKMKSKEEEKEGITYDLVIKLRPDLLIRDPIPERVLDNPDILWHSECSIDTDTQVSDKFAVSSSENMDYYTSVWKHLNEYWQRPLGDGDWKDIRVGERLMRHHLNQADIDIRSFSCSSNILRSREFYMEKNTTKIGRTIDAVLKQLF